MGLEKGIMEENCAAVWALEGQNKWEVYLHLFQANVLFSPNMCHVHELYN